MTLAVSLLFLTALAVTAYALYASIVPALPRIVELMEYDVPTDAKPRMIYYGIDRRTARRMEEEKRLVALGPRIAAPARIQRQTPLRHAA